jgi:hypothetical protein
MRPRKEVIDELARFAGIGPLELPPSTPPPGQPPAHGRALGSDPAAAERDIRTAIDNLERGKKIIDDSLTAHRFALERTRALDTVQAARTLDRAFDPVAEQLPFFIKEANTASARAFKRLRPGGPRGP